MRSTSKSTSFMMALTDSQLKGLGITSPVPVGTWNSAIKYQKLNIIRYNGASYIARTSNINVEPTVSPVWYNVWMPLAYDGGSVSPDGTYPNMTVGKAQNVPIFFGILLNFSEKTIMLTASDYPLLSNVAPGSLVQFFAADDSSETVVANNIRINAQGTGSVGFICDTTPSVPVSGELVIFN